jgi:hypothetical protein
LSPKAIQPESVQEYDPICSYSLYHTVETHIQVSNTALNVTCCNEPVAYDICVC